MFEMVTIDTRTGSNDSVFVFFGRCVYFLIVSINTYSFLFYVTQVPFLPGAYGIDEFHKKLEEFLYDKYKARPHWAKNNFLTINRVKNLYPNLDQWQQVYLLFNQAGIFDNEFTRKCGFDDFHVTKDTSDELRRTESDGEISHHAQQCPHCNTPYKSSQSETGNTDRVVLSQPQRQHKTLFSSPEQCSEEIVTDKISNVPLPQAEGERSAETEVASSQPSLERQTTV